MNLNNTKMIMMEMINMILMSIRMLVMLLMTKMVEAITVAELKIIIMQIVIILYNDDAHKDVE